MNTCQLIEYEITPSTTLAEVQDWVARDSRVTIEDQCPLLPRGQPPDLERSATQCWAPPVSYQI